MDAPAATDGDLVYLRGASFRDYERLVEIRGERGSPRLAYLDGIIELVSPSAEHEEMRSLLGRLLEAWCLARGVRFTALGQWTLKRAPKAAGLEPDECYVFHRPRGRRTRPDLAIEVQHSRRAVRKLEIYRRLGVREVWLMCCAVSATRQSAGASSYGTSTSPSWSRSWTDPPPTTPFATTPRRSAGGNQRFRDQA